jgi:hypothetical protein
LPPVIPTEETTFIAQVTSVRPVIASILALEQIAQNDLDLDELWIVCPGDVETKLDQGMVLRGLETV